MKKKSLKIQKGDKMKNYTLFGTKIFNQKTKDIGLILYTWVNKFADKNINFATCVDQNGKRYNIELDNIKPLEK